MRAGLQGRSLLTLGDYTGEEILYLIDLAGRLKEKRRRGEAGALLRGKSVVLLFEKTSTRTRCAFEAACHDEGGGVTFLTHSQMGEKESLEDTARVLGRYYHGIGFRGYEQATAEALSAHSGIPVWNALTDRFHPTQALADLLTLKECFAGPLSKARIAFFGDARNNVAASLLIACAKTGVGFTAVCPPRLQPDPALLASLKPQAAAGGAVIRVLHDPGDFDGADAVYTDVWVSMGEEERLEERVRLLEPYRVTGETMRRAGPGAVFLHCLPAFHDLNTAVGRRVFEAFGLREMEVSDEVFRSPASRVFDQAENRLHSIKAVLVASIGREEV